MQATRMTHYGFLCLLMILLAGCSTAQKTQAPESGAWQSDPAADAALQRGDLQEAANRYRLLLDSAPDNALAHYYLGYALGLGGDHQAEIEHYETAKRLGYAEGGFFYNMGMAYGELGELDKALQAFDKAVELEPDSAENRFGQGTALVKLGKTRAAMDAYEKAVQLDPAHVPARFALAGLLLQKGNLQAARSQLEAVLRLAPGHPLAQEVLREIDRVEQ